LKFVKESKLSDAVNLKYLEKWMPVLPATPIHSEAKNE
jgi:hypothetical protein